MIATNACRATAAAALGALLILGGCGKEAATPERAAAVDEWLSAKGADQSATGPMAEYMGWNDPDAMMDMSRENAKKQQQVIVECMREQGFEYVAFDPTSSFDRGDFDPFGGLTRAQYTKRWGYGISTMTNANGEPVDDAPGMVDDRANQVEDPNQEIRDALSSEEQAAYDKALYGDMSSMSLPDDANGASDAAADGGSDLDTGTDGGDESVDGEGSFEMPDLSKMGCQGAAISSATGFDDADMKAMSDAQEQLTKRVDADRRVKQASKAFRECMKAAGFPDVKQPGDAQESISERMSKLWEQTSSGGDTGSDLDAGMEGDPGAETDAAPPAAADGQLDASALKQLQKDEKAVALAELPCQAAYEVARQEVQFEAEEQFIKDNPELVARMKKSFG